MELWLSVKSILAYPIPQPKYLRKKKSMPSAFICCSSNAVSSLDYHRFIVTREMERGEAQRMPCAVGDLE
jgi:hypothetical protein